jgi:hypothetical protein
LLQVSAKETFVVTGSASALMTRIAELWRMGPLHRPGRSKAPPALWE